jgi:sarcosine oxidase subunit beta
VRLASGDEIAAPVVVNVAGPHSFKINRMADVEGGMNIKTKALRHEVAHVPAPDGFDYEHDGLHFSDQDTSCYARPEIGNHILVGSEDPECDTKEWVDPDNFNREFTEQWRVQVMRMAQRFTTLPIPNKMKGLVELYDVSDDWIPIYDKSDLPGFYMAVGTSGNQFKNAPTVGEMMAELIEACENGRDHDKDPVPFHLKHIKRDVNIGFYSRKRQPDQRSSFSVLG